MAPARFFKTADAFRLWLSANHTRATELLVGFHRKGSGTPSMTWPESVDEALCYGWIDGVRRTIDSTSYSIRFTPRRPKSVWSNVNVKKMEALIRQGRMQPAGLAAFALRDPSRSGIYAFEQAHVSLDAEAERIFKASDEAWAFFQSQPPSYRRLAINHVASARKPETRARRLAALIDHSARGERLAQYVAAPRKK